jgi:hypothetical protein
VLPSFFASDLHGHTSRYVTLFNLVREESPRVFVILGNDLDKIMMGIVQIIPQSWQFPEITAGRIVIEEKEYRNDNYRESE